MRIHLAVLAAFAAGAVLPLRAQEEAKAEGRPFRKLSLEELLKVEVRAPTKVEQPIREAPTVGTVITREQIEAYGWHTLADVLLAQTGFAPSQDYERVTASSRGQFESYNNNHLLLLVDGVPFNLALSGTAYLWDMLPLSMVESIEIIRGPGSALYGSNATDGVIAINTRKASEEFPVEASLREGTDDTRREDIVGGHAYPWISFLAGFSHAGTRGNVYDSYDGSGRFNADGRLQKFATNDKRWTDAGFLKLDGRGPLEGLSLEGHYAYWQLETAQGWLFIIPDEKERLWNSQAEAWLTYKPPVWLDGRLQAEFVAQGQRHEVYYRNKYLPDGFVLPLSATISIPFPHGLSEIVDAPTDDYFARAQVEYRFSEDMRVLLGVENSVFIGEREYTHEANADLNLGQLPTPFPDSAFHTLNSVWERILDKPIESFGTYLQYSSGRILNQMVSATLGMRYDIQLFEYLDITETAHPTLYRSMEQISPRAGLVFFPLPNLTLKALGEHAFRAPSPGEIFTANSLLGFTKPDQVQPERINTFTLAGDLALLRHVNLRTDWFRQDFENQIAFSSSRNYLTNLYSRTSTGLETELLYDLPLGATRQLNGFCNHTWVYQLDESIKESSITKSDRLTWAPSQVFNLGLSYAEQALGGSIQGHYQGRVYRRDSDHLKTDGTPTFFSAYRPGSVAPWFTLDAGVHYRLPDGLLIRVQGTNLFDKRGFLLKTGDYPFDYQIEGIRLLASVELTLQRTSTSQ